MTLIMEQAVFAAKAESVPGTAETLTASEAAFNIFDADIISDATFNFRNGQSSLDPLQGVAGSMNGRATFRTELVGNGSSGLPGWATVFLPACGFVASSTTYSPTTADTSHAQLTIAKYEDGTKRFLAGAMGTFNMTMRVGEPVMLDWEFFGVYQSEADATLLAPTYPTTLPPVFESATFTVGGTTFLASECVITIGNTVAMRADPTGRGGYRTAIVTNRNITVTMDPEASLVATKDWQAVFEANTEAALNIVVGSDSNNTMTINAPQAQVISRPGRSSRDGILVDNLTFQCNRNAAAGDDSLTIAFS